jgi:hypothetical protein
MYFFVRDGLTEFKEHQNLVEESTQKSVEIAP